jgi:hypothetical protein
MNRRKLFGMLSAACVAAMVPVKVLAGNSSPKLLTKEQWAKEVFGEPRTPTNLYPMVASFVASHPDVYLFKYRSGQWIFQTYDAASGNPTTQETVFLVSGKPDLDGGIFGKMPKHLEVTRWGRTLAIVGVSIGDSAAELNADLCMAYSLLKLPVAPACGVAQSCNAC